MDRHQDEKHLDRAVEKTFPASDPIAPRHPTSTEQPGTDPSRQPSNITPEQVDAAAPATEVCPFCQGTGKIAADEPDAEECPQCNGLGRVVAKDPTVDPIR